jgi:all-trans-retinol 13,14-reductase
MPRPLTGEHFDYAVVGAGVGGLAIGALLAGAGKRVIIFERHYLPGGYGQTFHVGEFAFCAELHYVWDCGEGQRVYRMLQKLGLHEEIRFRRLNPDGFDRIIAPGIDYTIGSGFDRERRRLSERFPECSEGLSKYYHTIASIHSEMYKLPIGFSWWTLASHPIRFRHIIRFLGWTLQEYFDALGFPRQLQLILAGQSAIFFMPPAQLSLLAHSTGVGSYDSGAYVPEKSFGYVIESLVSYIRRQPGCSVQLATEVTRIPVEDGRVRGVQTSRGDSIEADWVLFDGDPQLSLSLIGEGQFPESFRRKLHYDYGISALSVYLGLKGVDLRAAGFGDENIYWHPSDDLNAVYARQAADGIPDEPYFFCDAPTVRMTDPRLAPAGCHQLVMISPCSYEYFRRLRDRSEAEYQAAKQQYAERLISLAERHFVPDLSRNIITQVVGSPLTNERFIHAPRGNCYGVPLDTSHVNLGHVNYKSPFPNMHYVGTGSAMPGFASLCHFACLLYEELTGDAFYSV